MRRDQESPKSFAAGRTPARPGPGPMPEALLGALEVEARVRVTGPVVGEHRSPFLGDGTELAQVRPYFLGDDVRLLDPNATARTGEPHVRARVAERALTAWIALDASPSMDFGTADRRKADVAEGVAVALGSLFTRGGNRVGLLTIGDGGAPRAVPPKGGKPGMAGLLASLPREPAPAGTGATPIGEALDRVSRLARGRGLVAVVSDFRGPRDWRRPLAVLAGRHDVLAVEVRDPREGELPDVGDLWLEDPETGAQLRIDTGDRRLRERFAAEAARERNDLAHELRRSGADHVVLLTRGDWLGPFAASLGRRRARRATRGGRR